MSAIPKEVVDAALRFVSVSSLTAKKAVDRVHELEGPVKKAAATRGPVLQYMIAQGVVPKGQEKAAEAMLGDHAETLELLKSAVEKIAELKTELAKVTHGKQAADPGESVHEANVANGSTDTGSTQKVAGDYDSLNDPLVGRRTSSVKASDLPLLRAAGMAPR